MITFIKIPKIPSNNPLGEDVVKLLAEHKLNLEFAATEEILKRLVCKYHPEKESTVTIREETDDVVINACCSSFQHIIKTAIT